MLDADIQKISEELEISVDILYFLANGINYTTAVIHQKNPFYPSVITEILPNTELCDVQKRILEKYLHKLEISEHAAVCLSDKDLIKTAPPSTEKMEVKKCHIYMLYDNIYYDHVYGVISQLGMSNAATKLLTELCTCNGKLPEQGLASRYILNLFFKKFDEELFSMCSNYDVIYHRNVDFLKFVGAPYDLLFPSLTIIQEKLDTLGLKLEYNKIDLF